MSSGLELLAKVAAHEFSAEQRNQFEQAFNAYKITSAQCECGKVPCDCGKAIKATEIVKKEESPRTRGRRVKTVESESTYAGVISGQEEQKVDTNNTATNNIEVISAEQLKEVLEFAKLKGIEIDISKLEAIAQKLEPQIIKEFSTQVLENNKIIIEQATNANSSNNIESSKAQSEQSAVAQDPKRNLESTDSVSSLSERKVNAELPTQLDANNRVVDSSSLIIDSEIISKQTQTTTISSADIKVPENIQQILDAIKKDEPISVVNPQLNQSTLADKVEQPQTDILSRPTYSTSEINSDAKTSSQNVSNDNARQESVTENKTTKVEVIDNLDRKEPKPVDKPESELKTVQKEQIEKESIEKQPGKKDLDNSKVDKVEAETSKVTEQIKEALSSMVMGKTVDGFTPQLTISENLVRQVVDTINTGLEKIAQNSDPQSQNNSNLNPINLNNTVDIRSVLQAQAAVNNSYTISSSSVSPNDTSRIQQMNSANLNRQTQIIQAQPRLSELIQIASTVRIINNPVAAENLKLKTTPATEIVKIDDKLLKQLINQLNSENNSINSQQKPNQINTAISKVELKAVSNLITKLTDRQEFVATIKNLAQLETILEKKLEAIKLIEKIPKNERTPENLKELLTLTEAAARIRAMQVSMQIDLDDIIRRSLLDTNLEEQVNEEEDSSTGLESRLSRNKNRSRRTKKGTLVEDSVLEKSKQLQKKRQDKLRKELGLSESVLEIGGTKLGASTKAAKKLNTRGPSLELFNAFHGEGKERADGRDKNLKTKIA
jgi:hypothetical protein